MRDVCGVQGSRIAGSQSFPDAVPVISCGEGRRVKLEACPVVFDGIDDLRTLLGTSGPTARWP
jgi:hypothetical protein